MARMAMLGPWVASGWPVESDLGSFNASLLQEQMALQGAAVFKRCTMMLGRKASGLDRRDYKIT